MNCNTVTVLRAKLEGMETRQLEDMLLEALRQMPPDGERIRLIGSVLWARDGVPVIDEGARLAWARYQRRRLADRKFTRGFLVKAAAVVLVLLGLLAMVPREAKAMNFFERFIAWTEDIFSLTSPAETGTRETEYVFRTDNPGLQALYDQVTELGVTVPVVPMWLPEGYELEKIEVQNAPSKTVLSAVLSSENGEFIYQMNVYTDNVTSTYTKDDKEIQLIEKNGVEYKIIANKDLWVTVWIIENVECTIAVDCQEGIVNKILESIYTMEEY